MSHGDDKTESVSENNPSIYDENTKKFKEIFVTTPRTNDNAFLMENRPSLT